jgi:hypothetical protein
MSGRATGDYSDETTIPPERREKLPNPHPAETAVVHGTRRSDRKFEHYLAVVDELDDQDGQLIFKAFGQQGWRAAGPPSVIAGKLRVLLVRELQ